MNTEDVFSASVCAVNNYGDSDFSADSDPAMKVRNRPDAPTDLKNLGEQTNKNLIVMEWKDGANNGGLEIR